EHRRDFVERALHGPFGVHALFADDRRGTADEHRGGPHQQLRIEERGEISAADLRDAVVNLLQLFARAHAGALERGQLTRDAIRSDGKTNDPRALNRDQRRTDGDAARDADALQAFHYSSPNPDSTSFTSASTAA